MIPPINWMIEKGSKLINVEDNSLHDSTMSPNNNNPTQPLGQSSPETFLEVPTNPNSTIVDDVNFESQLPRYHLPPRFNRGIPPIKYEPDLKSKVRYPISDHVSSQKLSSPTSGGGNCGASLRFKEKTGRKVAKTAARTSALSAPHPDLPKDVIDGSTTQVGAGMFAPGEKVNIDDSDKDDNDDND
ncbi:hypothetical protein LWI28_007048 [Acer negundo]|uniref:Uncharacterized protein n=1 Tax=Acer negundo TaxID=4023 RepID=A0AAD5JD26_ACENE|nr:hypothetical protein LWI28_007048 [Acer negundo]